MDINLEKIDIIRERTGVSYKKAKDALESADGNVVEALIALEEESDSKWTKNMSMAGNEMIEKLKKVIEKGNVTRVILKKDNDVILNIPVTAGAIGVVLAPLVSILGISAALVTKTKIEIVQNDGKIYDLNEIAEEKVDEFRSKMKGNPTDQETDDILDDLDESGSDF
ncbi:protein of unknown function [Natronincola peptidivorans]|uniref:DUF4342 domain-containing protein n=1 Tax=Natronincola peptidivorans TaxID=426128 RepID=A0A1I0E7M8_9FIRM|nr:DUF4342 domain-containing protein [Natronincola peptidivorans]SET41019.1 protein of unknown function [Natronincola peptidivorans]